MKPRGKMYEIADVWLFSQYFLCENFIHWLVCVWREMVVRMKISSSTSFQSWQNGRYAFYSFADITFIIKCWCQIQAKSQKLSSLFFFLTRSRSFFLTLSASHVTARFSHSWAKSLLNHFQLLSFWSGIVVNTKTIEYFLTANWRIFTPFKLHKISLFIFHSLRAARIHTNDVCAWFSLRRMKALFIFTEKKEHSAYLNGAHILKFHFSNSIQFNFLILSSYLPHWIIPLFIWCMTASKRHSTLPSNLNDCFRGKMTSIIIWH